MNHFATLRARSFIAMACLAAATQANAQGTPSSKATAAINTTVGCTFAISSTLGDTLPVSQCHDVFTKAAVDVTPDNFVSIMGSTIKVSNSQSLFVSPSVVTGLYTQTRTKTSPGTTSTAMGEGGVYLRAIVKNKATGEVKIGYPVAACVPVDPNDPTSLPLGCASVTGTGASSGGNGVTLDSRIQTLTQTISDCVVTVGTTTGSCTFDLTTDLILQTTSAHTFNFIFPNVGVGVWDVQIQAAVNAHATSSGLATGIGGAAYGLGSVTVESVRLVHDFSF